MEKAIKYLSASLDPTKTQKMDKGKIELAEKYLDIVKENLATKVDMTTFDKEKFMLYSNISLAEYNRQNAKEQRKTMMELPYEWKQTKIQFNITLLLNFSVQIPVTFSFAKSHHHSPSVYRPHRLSGGKAE